jgi:hypothetical protein
MWLDLFILIPDSSPFSFTILNVNHRSNPSLNLTILLVAIRFSTPNHLTKYIVVVVHVCSRGVCISHQGVAYPVNECIKICI